MKRRGHAERNGGIFLVLIFLILVALITVLVLSLHTNAVDETLKNDSVIKVLFVMEDRNQVLFTDVLLYYPVSKRGALINILGNTGAIFRSLGRVDRIDAIYTELGIETYKQEIEMLIDMPIPFYIVLHRDHFGELADMLGGMKVLVPAPVDIKNDEGDRWLLPSGAVTLDGDKVNTYLTYEKPDESADEVQDRRQNVMLAFLSAIARESEKIRLSFPLYASRMESNIEGDNLKRLLMEIANLDAERIQPQPITGSRRVVDGKVLLFPFYDGQLIKDVVRQTTSALISLDENAGTRAYVLEIQNGTTVQGLARNTAVLLTGAGYDVLSTVNADRNDYEKTVIINHIGNAEAAKNIADFIHCKEIIDEEVVSDETAENTSFNVDFTIVLGRDFDGRYVK